MSRYTHLLRLIESTRDFEEQEQVERTDATKVNILLGACALGFCYKSS